LFVGWLDLFRDFRRKVETFEEKSAEAAKGASFVDGRGRGSGKTFASGTFGVDLVEALDELDGEGFVVVIKRGVELGGRSCFEFEALEISGGDLKRVEHKRGGAIFDGAFAESVKDVGDGELKAVRVFDGGISEVELVEMFGRMEETEVRSVARGRETVSAADLDVLAARTVIELGNSHIENSEATPGEVVLWNQRDVPG
jgi:hypothetical protein